MKLKTKIGAIACSAALCSMIAAPAFAADPLGYTEGQVNPSDNRQTPQNSDMWINAEITSATEVIKMTVPTAIPLIIQTNSGGTGTITGSFKTYVAPQNMVLKNYSYDMANNNLGFAVKVDITTAEDNSNLLGDVNLFLGATADASTTKLALNQKGTLFSSIAARSDANTPGTQAMKLHATDAKAGAALANDNQSASVKTVLHIEKA